jgi:3-hydroxyisobutyrate dehydrogenase
MNVIRQSSYFAPAFDRKLSNMLSRDFSNTNFPLKHLLKDINLASTEFSNIGVNTIPLEGVKNILLEAMRKNYSEQDYSALYSIINTDK